MDLSKLMNVNKEDVIEKREVKQIVFNDEQQYAINTLREFLKVKPETPRDNIITLAGFAGTGKTTCIKEVIKGIEGACIIIAPTHKALKVIMLNNPNVNNTATVAKTYGLRYNAIKNKWMIEPNAKTLEGVRYCIIDEVSMVDEEMFSAIEQANFDMNISTICIGDPAQIPPVGADEVSVAFDSERVSEVIYLNKIMRQADNNPNLKTFTEIRDNLLVDYSNFKTDIVSTDNGDIGMYVTSNNSEKVGIIRDLYSREEYKQNKNFAKIITYTNRKVSAMNQIARKAYLGNEIANNTKFAVGDLLVGYEQIAENNFVFNSSEYVVTKATNVESRTVKIKDYVAGIGKPKEGYRDPCVEKLFILKGTVLLIREESVLNDRFSNEIFIPDMCVENAEFFQWLFDMYALNRTPKQKENIRKLAYKSIANAFSEIQLHESIFVFENSIASISILKETNPELFKQDEFGRSEIDEMLEDGRILKLSKNIDYGYAISAHKSQGSTYENVVIDYKDIKNPHNRRIIHKEGEQYAIERSQILYVALSRTQKMNYVLV